MTSGAGFTVNGPVAAEGAAVETGRFSSCQSLMPPSSIDTSSA
jgi:hypothetical protein